MLNRSPLVWAGVWDSRAASPSARPPARSASIWRVGAKLSKLDLFRFQLQLMLHGAGGENGHIYSVHNIMSYAALLAIACNVCACNVRAYRASDPNTATTISMSSVHSVRVHVRNADEV